jgi:diketogulonate reductase-like aldo/keto reductase
MGFVRLPSGQEVPALGLGTWRMGEASRARSAEIDAVRAAIDIGYRLVDTAEMYGDGGAEEVVGAAVRAAIGAGVVRRDELTIVSKVLPSNSSREGVLRACERSLRRLSLDYVDLYLLHWRGSIPLQDTVGAFEQLRQRGHIRHWGVSNFDTSDMRELWSLAAGRACAANQVYYSASRRGAEFDLLPWQRKNRVVAMAYSPIDEGALAGDATFAAIGRRHGVSASTAALAWVLRQPDVIAIPKAVKAPHLRENYRAMDIELTAADLAEVDARFPPPKRKRPLAMA